MKKLYTITLVDITDPNIDKDFKYRYYGHRFYSLGIDREMLEAGIKKFLKELLKVEEEHIILEIKETPTITPNDTFGISTVQGDLIYTL